MSINLTVTADTPEELISTLQRLAAGFGNSASPIAVAAATQETATVDLAAASKPAKAKAAPKPAKAEEPAIAEAVVEQTVAQDEPAPAPEPEAEAAQEPQAPANGSLDFDKDVAPKVLGAVQAKGRDFVMDIISQFGVQKASEIPQEQWGELLALLAD